MKVKDIAEFKQNRDIEYLILEFERELKKKDDPFNWSFDDLTAQTETHIDDVGLLGVEIVKKYLDAFEDGSTRVDLYTKRGDEWVFCFSRRIDGFATVQLGVWDTIAAYRDKLKRQSKNEKKRKYRKGAAIRSVDDLLKQEFVYFDDKIYHCGWVRSWQLGMVVRHMENGRIFYAIRKENDNG